MDTLIVMGRCCRVSFAIRNLEYSYPTSLFEWTWTNTFTEINYVIERIINKEPLTVLRNTKEQHDYIEGTHIITSHYLDRNYKEILDRRANRFIPPSIKLSLHPNGWRLNFILALVLRI